MGWCWGWTPVVGLLVLIGHATSWFGAHGPVQSAAASALSAPQGLLSGAGSVVDQVFAWLFLLLAIQLVWGLLSLVVGEIKLRLLYDRRSRAARWLRAGGLIDRRAPTKPRRPFGR